MRILVLGANGMAGYGILTALQRYSKYTTYGTIRQNHILGNYNIIPSISANDIKKIELAISDLKINCVINCIGLIKQKKYSNIDYININSIFPHKLAQICGNHKARLIHLSTDCVFDGSKGNYNEGDNPTATDIYGQSKYCGEVISDNSICIRTSIIGQELNSQNSLVEWFLNNKNVYVNGYTNAIFSGFPTIILGNIIGDYIIENKDLSGLYNISSDPISKYQLLNIIANQFKKNILIKPDNSIVCDRSLNCAKFKSVTGFKTQNWESMIAYMYANWKNKND